MGQGIALKINLMQERIKIKKIRINFKVIALLLPFILMVFMFQILPFLTVVEGSFREDGQSVYSLYNYIYIF